MCVLIVSNGGLAGSAECSDVLVQELYVSCTLLFEHSLLFGPFLMYRRYEDGEATSL